MKGLEDADGAVAAPGQSRPGAGRRARPRHPAPASGLRSGRARNRAAPPEQRLAILAANAGLRHIEIVAWRDLDHPEAGGSEVHAARIAERWAAAGIDVHLTTSTGARRAPTAERDGYRTSRPAGRYLIFPAAVAAGLARRRARPDGVVEIWNGMPFLSPLWARHPRVVFLHHVHDGMWDLVLPPDLARIGKVVERRLAPPFYAGTPIVTLSESSRRTILETLALAPVLRLGGAPRGR